MGRQVLASILDWSCGDGFRRNFGARLRSSTGDGVGRRFRKRELRRRMTEEPHPIVGLTDHALDAMLKRATRNTLILGTLASLVLLRSEERRVGKECRSRWSP